MQPIPGGIQALWHVSYTVSDLERSLQFYCGLLGFTLVHRQRQSNAYTEQLTGFPGVDLDVAMLGMPGVTPARSGHTLELVQYIHPPGETISLTTNNTGVCHIAFEVADIHALHAKLSAAGVRFKSAPVAIQAGRNLGGFTVYFNDWDGIPLELVQPPPREQ